MKSEASLRDNKRPLHIEASLNGDLSKNTTPVLEAEIAVWRLGGCDLTGIASLFQRMRSNGIIYLPDSPLSHILRLFYNDPADIKLSERFSEEHAIQYATEIGEDWLEASRPFFGPLVKLNINELIQDPTSSRQVKEGEASAKPLRVYTHSTLSQLKLYSLCQGEIERVLTGKQELEGLLSNAAMRILATQLVRLAGVWKDGFKPNIHSAELLKAFESNPPTPNPSPKNDEVFKCNFQRYTGVFYQSNLPADNIDSKQLLQDIIGGIAVFKFHLETYYDLSHTTINISINDYLINLCCTMLSALGEKYFSKEAELCKNYVLDNFIGKVTLARLLRNHNSHFGYLQFDTDQNWFESTALQYLSNNQVNDAYTIEQLMVTVEQVNHSNNPEFFPSKKLILPNLPPAEQNAVAIFGDSTHYQQSLLGHSGNAIVGFIKQNDPGYALSISCVADSGQDENICPTGTSEDKNFCNLYATALAESWLANKIAFMEGHKLSYTVLRSDEIYNLDNYTAGKHVVVLQSEVEQTHRYREILEIVNRLINSNNDSPDYNTECAVSAKEFAQDHFYRMFTRHYNKTKTKTPESHNTESSTESPRSDLESSPMFELSDETSSETSSGNTTPKKGATPRYNLSADLTRLTTATASNPALSCLVDAYNTSEFETYFLDMKRAPAKQRLSPADIDAKIKAFVKEKFYPRCSNAIDNLDYYDINDALNRLNQCMSESLKYKHRNHQDEFIKTVIYVLSKHITDRINTLPDTIFSRTYASAIRYLSREIAMLFCLREVLKDYSVHVVYPKKSTLFIPLMNEIEEITSRRVNSGPIEQGEFRPMPEFTTRILGLKEVKQESPVKKSDKQPLAASNFSASVHKPPRFAVDFSGMEQGVLETSYALFKTIATTEDANAHHRLTTAGIAAMEGVDLKPLTLRRTSSPVFPNNRKKSQDGTPKSDGRASPTQLGFFDEKTIKDDSHSTEITNKTVGGLTPPDTIGQNLG
jgi:hypothetical protein